MDLRHHLLNLFPTSIVCSQHGVKLLGGAVSNEATFIKSIALKRAEKTVRLMALLSQFQEPQCQWSLLRACGELFKLIFTLRTYPPIYSREVAKLFDRSIRKALQGIIVSDAVGFGYLQWR